MTFRTRFDRLFVVMILAVIIGVFVTTSAFAAVFLKNSWARFSGTAGESLAIGDIVAIKDSDGKIYKADADDVTLRPAVGIVSKAASLNGVVGITTIGIFGGYTALAEGAPTFLSATAGAATQTAPSNWFQQIGKALTTTTYYFDFQASRSSVTVDSTSHTATNQTTDGTSISIPAGMFAAGKTLRITAGGTITGANAVKSVILYVDDAAIVTLTSTAAAAGNWRAVFEVGEYTDLAHQRCMGTLIAGAATGATAADVKVGYATDTTDFASAKTIKLQVVSGNAGDTIVQQYGVVEWLP
jgi:hypothetical protein